MYGSADQNNEQTHRFTGNEAEDMYDISGYERRERYILKQGKYRERNSTSKKQKTEEKKTIDMKIEKVILEAYICIWVELVGIGRKESSCEEIGLEGSGRKLTNATIQKRRKRTCITSRGEQKKKVIFFNDEKGRLKSSTVIAC